MTIYSPSTCLLILSARNSHTVFRFTVSPMDNKRDATSAGLVWPASSNRDPSALPASRTMDCSTDTMNPPPTVTPMTTPPDLDTTTLMDTYVAPLQPAEPFPKQDLPPVEAHRHVRYSERVVHQIHFKIFTHSNNERELFIEEIPTSGISKCRGPEHFFYGLSGNWEWSKQTSDYWRHHFEIPLQHGNNPFRNVAIDTAPPSAAEGSLTTLSTLAGQLSESILAARASGELGEHWRMVEQMSFHDALRAFQEASTSTSRRTD